MKKKPSISEFIHGGAADKIARGDKPDVERREQKVFRLGISTIEAVKSASFDASTKESRRVTETEIVELAIKKYLSL